MWEEGGKQQEGQDMAGGSASSASSNWGKFHQRSGQKPLGEGLRRVLLMLPGQALTKFKRHPPRVMPRTAAGKERLGQQSSFVFLSLQLL